MNDMDRRLFVNKIIRRYASDVPEIKQRLHEGEDRLLVCEIEALRRDRQDMHRRAQVAEGAADAAIGVVKGWLETCQGRGLNGHDILLRSVKRDLERAVFKALATRKEKGAEG